MMSHGMIYMYTMYVFINVRNILMNLVIFALSNATTTVFSRPPLVD